MRQTVDAYVGVYSHHIAGARASAIGVYTYLREASASLPILLYRAMRRPQSVGRATQKWLSRILVKLFNTTVESTVTVLLS